MATESTESTEKHELNSDIFSGFSGYILMIVGSRMSCFYYSSRRPSEGSTRAERRPARPDANTEAVTVSASATA